MKKFLLCLFITIISILLFTDSNEEIVVLIHGLRGTTSDMQQIADYLEEHNFETLNFTYPSKDHEIQNLSKKYLKPAIENLLKSDPAKIHFVTHSMGGIMLRSYLDQFQTEVDSVLGKVVMIAPPNQGSEVTEYFKETILYQKRYGISGQQLGFDLEKQVGIPDSVSYIPGIIAGTDTQFPYFSWFIPGEDDGKISVARTKLKGMGDFKKMNYPHDTIMKQKAVAEQVYFYLKSGKFQ